MAETHLIRRLETLSDIVFGLAITFMAYRLPTPDQSKPAPGWPVLLDTLGPHLVALLLSFCVAVIFWLSHHRRIANTPRLGPVEILLNFLLLLCVILLPITSDLFGTFGSGGDAVELYAGHLALISSINFVLWLIAAQGTVTAEPVSWRSAVGPGFVSAIFVLAALTAHWHRGMAKYIMLAAFTGPLVSFALRDRATGGQAGPTASRGRIIIRSDRATRRTKVLATKG